MRIEVYVKENLVDAAGEGLLKDIEDLNIRGAESARVVRVTEIEGSIDEKTAARIGAELLSDPISQKFKVGKVSGALTKGAWVVSVRYNHGVTDPVAESTLKGIADLGISGAAAARTSTKAIIRGGLSREDIETICSKLLANSVIQSFDIEKN